MSEPTSGADLRAEREAADVTATDLGRAMGYDGPYPHTRVSQIEALARVTPTMAQRYRTALATLVEGKS